MPEIKTIAQHFHERTKYDPETIGGKPLNWEQQPSPYKIYQVGKVYDLKVYLTDAPPDHFLTDKWQRLSRLLLCSYGLTARMRGDIYLRSAPSAGGLYPAEVYLVANNRSFLAPGIYSYQPQTHTLVHFWESAKVWESLQAACFEHPSLAATDLAIAITGVFYRSAWRYQDRAYRRIFLDTGHLLGNIELAAAINHFRPYLIGGFNDQLLAELLYISKDEEGAIAIVPLLDLPTTVLPNPRPALASGTTTDYPKLMDGQLLGYLHAATEIATSPTAMPPTQAIASDKYNLPFCSKFALATSPISWGQELDELETTILRRRSTRAFTGDSLSLDQLKSILDFAYQPQHYTKQGLDGTPDYFDLSLIETFIAVSAVTDLEDGCYYYAPLNQELRQIRFKNFRSELHFLCLGQELGRDAAVVIFHTADLAQAIQKYGDRSYRYLHLDAGHLGQKINLAAIQLGLGVSGIAGFFDDHVNEVLGIPPDEAVLYITTLGCAS